MSDSESIGSIGVEVVDDNKVQLKINDDQESENQSQEEVPQEAAETTESSLSSTTAIEQAIEQEDEQKRVRSIATVAWRDGNDMIIEDQYGEIMRVLPVRDKGNKATNSRDSLGGSSAASPMTQTASQTPTRGSISRVATSKSTSSEESASSSSGPKRQPSEQQIFAHQIDKMVTLENGDGDIIRRYRIEATNADKNQKMKIKLVTKNVLNKLKPGNKRRSSSISKTPAPEESSSVSPTDVDPQPHNILVKEYDMKIEESPLRNPKVEKKIEDKLNTVINQQRQKTGVAKILSKKQNQQSQSTATNS